MRRGASERNRVFRRAGESFVTAVSG